MMMLRRFPDSWGSSFFCILGLIYDDVYIKISLSNYDLVGLCLSILNEVQLLSKETLEEVCFLLNKKMDSHHPMVLILIGQNELLDKLKLQYYAAIRLRTDIKCQIPQ